MAGREAEQGRLLQRQNLEEGMVEDGVRPAVGHIRTKRAVLAGVSVLALAGVGYVSVGRPDPEGIFQPLLADTEGVIMGVAAGWRLAPGGSAACGAYGTPATPAQCLAAASAAQAAKGPAAPKCTGLVKGGGGKCHDNVFGDLPNGCTAQLAATTCHPHFVSRTTQTCPAGAHGATQYIANYFPVCYFTPPTPPPPKPCPLLAAELDGACGEDFEARYGTYGTLLKQLPNSNPDACRAACAADAACGSFEFYYAYPGTAGKQCNMWKDRKPYNMLCKVGVRSVYCAKKFPAKCASFQDTWMPQGQPNPSVACTKWVDNMQWGAKGLKSKCDEAWSKENCGRTCCGRFDGLAWVEEEEEKTCEHLQDKYSIAWAAGHPSSACASWVEQSWGGGGFAGKCKGDWTESNCARTCCERFGVGALPAGEAPPPPKDDKEDVCMAEGDPHFTDFGGHHFNFQEVGELPLYHSGDGKVKVNVFTCPWVKRYVGAASQIGMAIEAGGHKIEIVGDEVTVDGAAVTTEQSISGVGDVKMISESYDHMWNGKTWAEFTLSGFLVTVLDTSVKVMYAYQYESEDIPPGYIYNTVVHAPKGTGSSSTGLCKGAGGVQRLQASASMFSKAAMPKLQSQCFKATGVSMDAFKEVTSAEEACKVNKHDIAEAKATCAKVPESTREFCVYDFCSQGSATAALVASQAASMYEAELHAKAGDSSTAVAVAASDFAKSSATEKKAVAAEEKAEEKATEEAFEHADEKEEENEESAEKPLVCTATGDPHVTSFGGKHFPFQAVGELPLYHSGDGKLKVNVFTCPWVKKYVGAASQIGMAVYAGGFKIEMMADEMTVDGKPVKDTMILPAVGDVKVVSETYHHTWNGKEFGDLTLSGFIVTAYGTSVKAMYAYQYESEDIPPGYIYQTAVHVPEGAASSGTGFCKGAGGVSRVAGASTLFSAKALSEMNHNCFKATGVTMSSFKAIASAEDACKTNKHDMKEAKEVCKNVPESSRADCVYDFCSQGSALAAMSASQGAAMYKSELEAKAGEAGGAVAVSAVHFATDEAKAVGAAKAVKEAEKQIANKAEKEVEEEVDAEACTCPTCMFFR